MRSIPVLRPIPWRRRVAWVVSVAVACSFLGAAPPARAGETLDQALRREATELVGYLRRNNYQNVGVLKFRVAKGNEEPSDNAGPLNLSLARRLETALVLADPDDKLGIIKDASAALVEAGNGRANHLTPDGRKACFDTAYPLAWGAGKPVRADFFLTGCVRLSADRSTTVVTIYGFNRHTDKLQKLGKPFSVPTDVRTLVEAGESYRLPDKVVPKGAFDDEVKLVRAEAKKTAEVTVGEDKFPLPDASAPVQLKVLYDGRPVAYRVKDGKAFVPEPRQGQQVTFLLRNNTAEVRGVVLMLNGENTIYREKGDVARCTPWVLQPHTEYGVTEYQMDEGHSAPFEVQSQEESAKDEVNYGEPGTFTLAVFRPRPALVAAVPADLPKDAGPAPSAAGGAPVTRAKAAEDDAQEVDIISKGLGSLSSQPGTLEALKGDLRARGNGGLADGTVGKGMVHPGRDQHAGRVDVVSFERDPTPVFLATIRYYQPKNP